MVELPDLPAPPRRPLPAFADEVAEGVELCEFVTRIRTKNRVLVDVLTDRVIENRAAESWRRFVAADLRRLASQARADAVRAARLRDVVAGFPGRARSAHDYRADDAGHLDRRARIGRATARELRRRARSRNGLAALVAAAGLLAADEVRSAAAALPEEDAEEVLERAARIVQLSTSAGRSTDLS